MSITADGSGNLALISTMNGISHFTSSKVGASGRLQFMKILNMNTAPGQYSFLKIDSTNQYGGVSFDIKLVGSFSNFNNSSYRYVFTLGVDGTGNHTIWQSGGAVPPSTTNPAANNFTATDVISCSASNGSAVMISTYSPYLYFNTSVPSNLNTSTIFCMQTRASEPGSLIAYIDCTLGGAGTSNTFSIYLL